MQNMYVYKNLIAFTINLLTNLIIVIICYKLL